MNKTYLVTALVFFLLFCGVEYKGIAFDGNQSTPRPEFYSPSSSSGGHSSSSSSFFYFSSK